MGSTKVLFLISFLLLLNIQPSSPSIIGLKLVDSLRRRLLQATSEWTTKTPDNTHLKLCETDVCDSRRPDGPRGEGLCDRWARGEQCPEEQIFHVWGDPGSNDKAEMFFNLRSPWNVSCEKVCLPLPYFADASLNVSRGLQTCVGLLLACICAICLHSYIAALNVEQ